MLSYLAIADAVAPTHSMGLWSLVSGASGVAKGVLVLLAIMSLVGWYIIGYKFMYIRRATQESDEFLEAFWGSKDISKIYERAKNLERSPLAHMFVAGYSELSRLEGGEDRDGDLETIERS